jgi:hypothetical protein
MRALFVSAFVAILASSAVAQPDPEISLLHCSLPSDAGPREIAQQLMQLSLPYLDQQIVYYRDEDARITGYAVRRSLRIFFYSASDKLLGTAVRRTADQTSYFDARGDYLGRCIDHKMELP